MLSLPAEIVVTPVNVFVPDNVNVPEPALVKLPDPHITPETISFPLSPVVNVTQVSYTHLTLPTKA